MPPIISRSLFPDKRIKIKNRFFGLGGIDQPKVDVAINELKKQGMAEIQVRKSGAYTFVEGRLPPKVKKVFAVSDPFEKKIVKDVLIHPN